MTAPNREQIRRELDRGEFYGLANSRILALLETLEQAERDRDETHADFLQLSENSQGTIDTLNRLIDTLNARLATVPALVEAADQLLDFWVDEDDEREDDERASRRGRQLELEHQLGRAVTTYKQASE